MISTCSIAVTISITLYFRLESTYNSLSMLKYIIILYMNIIYIHITVHSNGSKEKECYREQ